VGKRKILTAEGPRRGVQTTRLVVARRVRAGGHRFFCSEGGFGAPLLLLHGLGASSRWWYSIFPELTSESFRIVAPDLPGFGRSGGPALSVTAAARAVVELADRLGIAQFFLCGHSMGGAIAAQVAADVGSRVRRLVLMDSAGIPGRRGARWLGRLVQPWSWCPAGFYGTLLGDLIRARPRALVESAHHLRRYDIRPTLELVRAPTLIIWGERDYLTPLDHGRVMLENLNNGRLEVITRARHLPMVSHPETTSRLIVDFFKEDLPRRRR
jgi:pimeloyl-ACP methyl ester carboxylesterase